LDCNNIKIVCYAGGTCGDLVSAIIDSRGAALNSNGTALLPQQRTKLKKPHMFETDASKDQYMQMIFDDVDVISITSHDLAYHLTRHHQIIGITVQQFDIALWAAKRFKNLHRAHVWQEMQSQCGASTVEEYAQTLINYSSMISEKTDKIIGLEDVVSGQAISALQHVLKIDVDTAGKDFYQSWLNIQQL
jgi:glycerol kinase